jgi:F0F1-type ATP synthase assembly protein I
MSQQPPPHKNSYVEYAKYSTLAIQLIAIVLIFVGLGYAADRWLLKAEKPWLTAASAFIGSIFAMLYLVRKTLKQ